jgi:ABC-type polysaccharide/polyol phosphate export permease
VLKTWRDLALMDIRDYYPSLWAWGGLIIATLLSLVIYWYTSQAFSTSIGQMASGPLTNYFSFIIIGELSLTIPQLLMEAPTQVIKQAVSTGAMTTFLQLPCASSTPIITWSTAKIPTELLRILLNYVLVIALFGAVFSFSSLLTILLLAIITAPIFLGIGLLASALVVAFGRGEKVLGFAVNALSVFSGIYFPISVLPASLQEAVSTSSPLFWVLEKARAPVFVLSATESIAILFCGMIFLFVGIFVLRVAFNYNQKTGSTWILRY